MVYFTTWIWICISIWICMNEIGMHANSTLNSCSFLQFSNETRFYFHASSPPRTLLLIQNRLREEHSLQDVLFKNVMRGAPTALPPRSVLISSQSVFLTRRSFSIRSANKHADGSWEDCYCAVSGVQLIRVLMLFSPQGGQSHAATQRMQNTWTPLC